MKFERAMNFKGTKGEWVVEKAEKDSSGRACYRVSTYIRAQEKELKANAKLIAAAPDLLEACQRFVDKCDTGRARSVESYSQMKAAIEKALTD
jgi:hypothetical protein